MKLFRLEIHAAPDSSPSDSHIYVYEDGMQLSQLETAVVMLTAHLEKERSKTLAQNTMKTILDER